MPNSTARNRKHGRSLSTSIAHHFRARVDAEEKPGRYFFIPFAALITAGSRLFLALLEHEITTRNDDWLLCDTDSCAALTNYASESQPGALTVAEINEIIDSSPAFVRTTSVVLGHAVAAPRPRSKCRCRTSAPVRRCWTSFARDQ
jgi:hypothetical protein